MKANNLFIIFKNLASIVTVMMKCGVEFIPKRKSGGIDGTFTALYRSLAFKIVSHVRHLYFNSFFFDKNNWLFGNDM